MMEADNQLFHMVGRIEGKIDAALSEQKRTNERLGKVEDRVTNLEATRHSARGSIRTLSILWTAAAAGLGAVFALVKEYLFK